MTAISLLFLEVTTASNAVAHTAKDVGGVWTLVSITLEQDGKKSHPFGPNPTGILILDANGHYSGLVRRSELPKYASNNRMMGTPKENEAIVQGSLATFGTYSINPADNSIIFHIEKSTYPNWDGTEQKRSFTLTGDELRYVNTTPTIGAGKAEIVWKRAK
jgi:hypothetical protein